jgi:hypothetical protein
MNAQLPHRTLGELRQALRARLGFARQGPAADGNREVLDGLLQEAQDYLAAVLPRPIQRILRETAPGSRWYDWHDPETDAPIDPTTVQAVWIAYPTEHPTRLAYGIREPHRAQTLRGLPCRYDTFAGQCELWPTPAACYRFIIEAPLPLKRLTQDRDTATFSDRLVFLYALAAAKAHYRHPDAAVSGKAFESLLAQTRAQQHGVQRYYRAGPSSGVAQVMSTPHGYRFSPGA